MFVFNLTSVVPSEQILSAEVHFYKRRSKNKKKDLELLLYEIAPHYMTENGKITLRSGTFGWQWYDVTDASVSCLAARRDTPHLFGLNFKVERNNGKSRNINLRKFITRHSMPFLIIYSNDTQNINLDQLDNNLSDNLNNNRKISHRKSNSKSRAQDSEVNIDISRTLLNTHVPEKTSIHNMDLKLATEELLNGKRKRRSVFDNEIPEIPIHFTEKDNYPDLHSPSLDIPETHTVTNRLNVPETNTGIRKIIIPDTHPGILQTRRESRHKLSFNSKRIPYPKKSKRKRRRNRKRNKNKLRRNRKHKNNHNDLSVSDKSCGKKKFILDFADIGWENKIIAPKSFEAHYCAGSCPFPLTKVRTSSRISFMIFLT